MLGAKEVHMLEEQAVYMLGVKEVHMLEDQVVYMLGEKEVWEFVVDESGTAMVVLVDEGVTEAVVAAAVVYRVLMLEVPLVQDNDNQLMVCTAAMLVEVESGVVVCEVVVEAPAA